MKYPKRIVLVRHGESQGNVIAKDDAVHPSIANHQFALTERGREQARITGEYLRDQFGAFDTCFCSSFLRTEETLRWMMPRERAVHDARLNEWWRGIWHSLPKTVVEEHFPVEKVIQEREGRYHYRAPGGENGPDVELRIRSFITDLRLFHAGETVLISGHGNWIILFQRIIENLSLAETMRRTREHTVKNAAVVAYELAGDRLRQTIHGFAPWEWDDSDKED
jgi:broad specificity phosphatase PhoE